MGSGGIEKSYSCKWAKWIPWHALPHIQQSTQQWNKGYYPNLHGWDFSIPGGAGKARFNVATPTYEARTRPLHVQHTYYRIIFKQNPFNIISRGVQRWTSTDFRLK